MANWLGNPEKVYSDRDVSLSAPSIGPVLAAILKDRLDRQKLTGESIAETIKNVRENRQGDAYTEQLKASGLLPAGSDVGGPFGAKYGHDIADLTLRKLREEREQNRQTNIMDPYYKALTDRAKKDPNVYPGSEQDDSFNAEFPETKKINGIWHRRVIGPRGRINYTPYTTRFQEEEDLPERTMGAAAVKQALANVGLTEEDIANHNAHHGYAGGAPAEWDQATDIEIDAAGGGHPRLSKQKFEGIKRALGMSTGPAPSATPGATPPASVTPGPSGTPTPGVSPSATPGASPRHTTGTAKGYGRVLTAKEKDALAWARTHPNDPRAPAILHALGID